MAGFDPWQYAENYKSEHANQAALFMWANMAMLFGVNVANDPHSYTVPGFAKTQFENAGKLGYKLYSPPVEQLKWLHAIHNQGHGDKIRGGKARAEGVKAGVADIFLPVPAMESEFNAYYHGLYIELKVGYNKADEKQLDFQTDMRNSGYAAEVCNGWLAARDCILKYLGLE